METASIPDLMTVNQTAREFPMFTEAALRHKISTDHKGFKSVTSRVGKRIYIDRTALEKWIADNTLPAFVAEKKEVPMNLSARELKTLCDIEKLFDKCGGEAGKLYLEVFGDEGLCDPEEMQLVLLTSFLASLQHRIDGKGLSTKELLSLYLKG
jgi:Fe-S cluster biosynthesis and repair protein YggX